MADISGLGFPKMMGTLGGAIIRIVLRWGLHWGRLFREATKYNHTSSPYTGDTFLDAK